ncbi:MAG: hypothetical protein ABIA63_03270, partial [bacterium]
MNYKKIWNWPKGTILKGVLVLIIFIGLLNGCFQVKKTHSIEERMKLANALASKELYIQAIDVFNQILKTDNPDPATEQGIYNTVGDLYFERVKDYENAMAAYMAIKSFYPQAELNKKANKRIVECLERLERSNDAIRAISSMAAADSAGAGDYSGFPVVARIQDRDITLKEIEDLMGQLPKEPEKKKEAVKQYTA